MSLVSLATQPVTLHRYVPGATDPYGNPTATYDDLDLLANVAPAGMSEALGDAATVTEGLDLVVPGEVVIDARDEVTVGGTRYAVQGDGVPVWHPRRRAVAYTRARLRRSS